MRALPFSAALCTAVQPVAPQPFTSAPASSSVCAFSKLSASTARRNSINCMLVGGPDVVDAGVARALKVGTCANLEDAVRRGLALTAGRLLLVRLDRVRDSVLSISVDERRWRCAMAARPASKMRHTWAFLREASVSLAQHVVVVALLSIAAAMWAGSLLPMQQLAAACYAVPSGASLSPNRDMA